MTLTRAPAPQARAAHAGPRWPGRQIKSACIAARPCTAVFFSLPGSATTARSIRQSPSSVDVEFSDGTHGTYDLVVAADGASSAVRQALFGPQCAPGYNCQAVWRAMVRVHPG
jgi:hypothetical protein